MSNLNLAATKQAIWEINGAIGQIVPVITIGRYLETLMNRDGDDFDPLKALDYLVDCVDMFRKEIVFEMIENGHENG